MSELKPCPFCGGKGYLCQIPSASGGDRYIWIAKCSTDDGCGVEFPGTSRKVDAIKEWNRRYAAGKHIFWNAGEIDCPKEIKSGNGELHTLRCKVCGGGPANICKDVARDLTAENARLKKALEHYADDSNWQPIVEGRITTDIYAGEGCGYDLAREALAKIGEQR